jgi:hypothetical protein
VYIVEKVHNRACIGTIKAFDKVYILKRSWEGYSGLLLETPSPIPKENTGSLSIELSSG